MEVETLLEASLQVLTLFLLLRHYEALLWRPVLVREGGSVHDMHVVNTVCPYLPEFVDQHISIIIGRLFISMWVLRR